MKEGNLNFIEKAKKIHGDKYDYSKINYIKATQKILIICPIHEEFEQTPNNHLTGFGCRKCGEERTINSLKRITNEYFFNRMKSLYGRNDIFFIIGDKIENQRTRVLIVCPIHGEINTSVSSLMQKNRQYYCRKCGLKATAIKNTKWDFSSFIEKAKEIHGDKYDYLENSFTDYSLKVEIVCKKHGSFLQKPAHHINRKHGCPKCKGEKTSETLKISKEKFIKRCKKNHLVEYDYSLFEHKGWDNDIIVICPIHGNFNQRLSVHINGANCPKCQVSKGEEKIMKYLQDNFISFIAQASSKKLFTNNLFVNSYKRTSFDFFIPTYNLLIEFDGQQHYDNKYSFGASADKRDKNFKGICNRDLAKDDLVKQSEYSLIRIPFWEIGNIEKILGELFKKSNKLNKKIIEDFTYEKNIRIFMNKICTEIKPKDIKC